MPAPVPPLPPPKPVLTRKERSAKREAKRAKQREENVGRAAKMHAARLVWERSGQPQANTAATPPTAQVHIGCSGWFYWHWRGSVYPAGLATKDWFRHYSQWFGTVELNAPFYSWPTVAAVRTWLRQLARLDFVYTVKASELITHVRRFAGTKTLIRDFGHIADLLGPRMGCFLFQLPPSFHYTPARLKRIVSQLDPARRNVVELRHRTWWNDRVFNEFRRAGIIFCSSSAPRLPDALVTTADDIYIRFHGVKQWYRHDYTPLELARWAARIRVSNPKRIWAYFNNDRDGYAVQNARELQRQLSSHLSG